MVGYRVAVERTDGGTWLEYKGNKTLSIDINGRPFTFGKAKAEAVLENIEEIKKFLEMA
jgi:hypothetical protein